jgi:hypothetical protein
MKKLLLSLALLVAVSAWAQPGLVNQSATGTNNPVVYFPGSEAYALRVVSYDLTGSQAADKLTLKSGTTRLPLLKAATATSSNLVFAKTGVTFASNDVLLAQSAAGLVVAATVQTNVYQTNKTITFNNVLGTNLAVGDKIRERLTVPYTVQAVAGTAATVLFVDTVTGLAGNDILVLNQGGKGFLTNLVSSVATANRFRYSLRDPAETDAAIGDVVYYTKTNTTTIADVTAFDGLSLNVATTNGFTAADIVLISTTRGLQAIRTIDTGGVTLTNLTLTVAPGFATAAGDRVTVISGARTLIKPVVAGASSILLDALTAMADGTNIVVAPTGKTPWENKLVSTNSVESIKSITLDHTFGVAVYPGQLLYEASLTALTTTFAADQLDKAIVCDVATSIVADDTVYIFPASAVPICYKNTVAKTPEDFSMLSVTNSNVQLGAAMAAGDSVYLAGNTATFLVGAASVTAQNAVGLWQAGRGSPASATLTTTNGLIRNLTGEYK